MPEGREAMAPHSADITTASGLSALLRHWAHAHFDAVGIAPAVVGLGVDRLNDWLAEGKQGEMTYMARHAEARRDPNLVLEGVQAMVMVALAYPLRPQPPSADRGRVSSYAWGIDYHHRVRSRLKDVQERLRGVRPDVRSRIAVDSAPVMERDYARLAGLGWIGKNTLLLNKSLGSAFFLGALLVSTHLEPDAPMETEHCGRCRRCLDACPTQAFEGPYRLDPRRCISYLTIEHRSSIPMELRPLMGPWMHGCDICQEVCPWNRRTNHHPSEGDSNSAPPSELRQFLHMDESTFQEIFRSSAMRRAGRAGLVRNALIAARNLRAYPLLPEIETLLTDPSPIVRQTAAWAHEQLTSDSSGGLAGPCPWDDGSMCQPGPQSIKHPPEAGGERVLDPPNTTR